MLVYRHFPNIRAARGSLSRPDDTSLSRLSRSRRGDDENCPNICVVEDESTVDAVVVAEGKRDYVIIEKPPPSKMSLQRLNDFDQYLMRCVYEELLERGSFGSLGV